MQLQLHARISNFNDKLDMKRKNNLRQNIDSSRVGVNDNNQIAVETKNQINTLQLKNEILK